MESCEFNFRVGNGLMRDGDIRLPALRELGSLYQNEVQRQFYMMTEQEFKDMRCVFKCKKDPRTGQPFEKHID